MGNNGMQIDEAKGKLGIFLPGLGAVSTTFIAGIYAILKGLALPIGSLTQMGTIRLGKRTDKRIPKIKDFVPLSRLEDLEFAGWDVFEDDCYKSALNAGVLQKELIDQVQNELAGIKPMKAVFEKNFVKKLDGPNVKTGKSTKEVDHWEAIGAFGNAMTLKPESTEPLYYMGEAYRKKDKKDYKTPVEYYKKAVELDPESEHGKLSEKKMKEVLAEKERMEKISEKERRRRIIIRSFLPADRGNLEH
ncbi:inositol-3-phosphate synthase [candidate division KSB1 bacterium]